MLVNDKMINETINIIAGQVNARELNFAGFKFVYDNKNLSLMIMKGTSKKIIIRLDKAKDSYEVRKIKFRKFDITSDETIKNVYCHQLCDHIEEFFKFRYINKVVFN